MTHIYNICEGIFQNINGYHIKLDDQLDETSSTQLFDKQLLILLFAIFGFVISHMCTSDDFFVPLSHFSFSVFGLVAYPVPSI